MRGKKFPINDWNNLFIEDFSEEKDIRWRKSISCGTRRERAPYFRKPSHSLDGTSIRSDKKNGPRLRRPLKRHKRNREHLFPTESTSLETFRSWWLSRNRPTVPAIFDIITEKLPADGSSAVASASFFYTLPGNSILAFLFVGRCLEKANWTSFKVAMEIIWSWWIGRCNRGRDDRRPRRKDRVVEKGVTERWKEIK